MATFALGEPIAHVYWNVGYKNVEHSAKDSIVLVTVNDRPRWTTAELANLLGRLRVQMPRRVIFDAAIPAGENADGDARMAEVIRSFGDDITFVARGEKANNFNGKSFSMPPRRIIGGARVALSTWQTNFLENAVAAPYQVFDGNRVYTTLSTELTGVHSGFERTYFPDFSVDPDTIRQFPSQRLFENTIPASTLTGRTVIVTAPDRVSAVRYFGHGMVPAIALDIAGAHGLELPFSLSLGQFLGSLPILILVVALVALGAGAAGRRKAMFYTLALVATLLLPMALRLQGIVFPPDCAILFLATYGGLRLWQKRIRRIQLTSASGLPNLLALANDPLPVGSDLVVAVIARYEEILTTLPRELHGEWARQIARRITAGSGTTTIYHGEGGQFGWCEEARPLEMQLDHLEGLRALFAAPLIIGSYTFDTNIHFGLDRNEGLDTSTRVNSALASANEALSNGRSIELFEAQRLAEAPWELSLHARIEEGLRNGDIWLAYQPQWHIAENRICGAEALIRWNHPTRGPISPDAFILQAERAGRIDALTYWVLDLAITAALALNTRGPRFQMSVNLSAQMVDKSDLVANFARIVERRGIDPTLLTVEVTETSSVRNRPVACQNLTRLREMGFRLSIDDFGTGEASLAYLADLPSDELKIDRRFVSRITSSPRDATIVANTISLAHALGQTVVAEGIEDPETLAVLRDLGCDLAQGYHLGRPQAFEQLEKAYDESLLQFRTA
ncbi:EAL domain-containing protein [Novosphingobium sp. AAP93]|uniref:EAL domain-containing protein n=1 Tax=Novosphingobium sp. AAP93 TaxID=1523427 RepID=UPI000A8C57F1|nr:EAL domain-containing protein [Novosphingobium sp. AAP93]